MTYTGRPEAPAASGIKEKKRLSHDAYTVGWICVLSSELIAARALLDEQLEQLPSAAHDDNRYLLGHMAGHNVAIASTGSGIKGTAAAAQTAVQMIRSFHNIRFGLMVGVGGGAPSPRNDIRLGDVVVSVANGSHGGVLQYDMGKWTHDKEFSIESHLNKPPTILSKAIDSLKSDYAFEEGLMSFYIREVAIKAAKFRNLKEYRYPGRDKDQLFSSAHRHATGENCSACDPTQVEQRQSRESDDPMVYYGLIASGNAVIKSAKRRDELRDAWGVLCFEMEAAGLMDNFPCIVIRGISDYADDHKNEVWQPYSAVAAAAYAKDLLRTIQKEDIKNMEAVTETLGKLSEDCTIIREAVTCIKSRIANKEHIEVLEWLAPGKYGLQQSDYFHKRQPGTGQWLLNSAEFQKWLQTSKQTLFCQGIPGAGKTILTSIVIDNLHKRFNQDSTVGIAYFYCNYQGTDDQQVNNLLASFLRQLSESQPSLPSIVKDLYNFHWVKHTRPSLDEIYEALQSVVQIYSKVFLIVDALDECQTSNNNRKIFLTKIFALQDMTKANIFATSRYIQDTQKAFDGSILLDIRAQDDEIRQYLEDRISGLPSFILKRPDLRERIVVQIASAIDGMFLLAKLHLNSLQDKPNAKAILQALNNLPKGNEALNQTYKETMQRIQKQGPEFQQLTLRTLLWLTFAMRQLSTFELQGALAVEKGSSRIDQDNISEIQDIVSACAGLVTVDEKSNIVRLAHYTTQEYFQRTQKEWFPDAQTEIASTCITYLSFDTFSKGVCTTFREYNDRMQSHALYSYAAHNWGHHARDSTGIHPQVNTLFNSQPNMEAAWQVWERKIGFSYEPNRVTALHLTAFFGLQDLTKQLLSKHDPNVQTTSMERPLSAAHRGGHRAIIKLLLEKGADLKFKCNMNDWPQLIRTALNGHEAVFKLLLKNESYLESEYNEYHWIPQIQAIRDNHEAIIKLIESRRYLESKDEASWTSLIFTVKHSHEALVNLLTKNENDLESKDGNGWVELIRTVGHSRDALFKLLTSRIEA